MPKAKAKKNTDFQNRMTRSFFFYGKPNTGKLSLLNQMQTTYTDLVNRNIQLLAGRHDLLLQLVKNDKKDSDMRKLEKSVRPSGLSSAFCQNAFDCAITHLSNWLNDIRLDMNQENSTIFTRSKVLFAMMLMNASQSDMIAQMNTIAKETKKDKTFYESLGQQVFVDSSSR